MDLEYSDVLGERRPLMASAAPLIADPIVRNRGTLVGSLCHADPQGDWASVMLALDGEVVAAGPTGRRVIPMAEFVTGPFQNALLPGEIAVEARVPAPRGTPAGRYLKLERRVGDFATVGVAVALETSGGKVVRAGIALTGVGGNNIKAAEAEQVLVGQRARRGRPSRRRPGWPRRPPGRAPTTAAARTTSGTWCARSWRGPSSPPFRLRRKEIPWTSDA